MNKIKPALVLYFTATLMYVLSVFFHWDPIVTFLFKPMITPTIFFYYWQESNGKIKLFPSLVLWFFYIGDMMILIEFENLFIPLVVLNLFAYFILGFYLTIDLFKIKNPVITKYMVLTIAIVIAFLLSFLYAVLMLIFNSSDAHYGLLLLYGIVLVLLGIETVLFYILKNNEPSFHLLMGVLCLVICDLFYVLYNFYDTLEVFIDINIFCQATSFYFIVNYFIYRSRERDYKIAYEEN